MGLEGWRDAMLLNSCAYIFIYLFIYFPISEALILATRKIFSWLLKQDTNMFKEPWEFKRKPVTTIIKSWFKPFSQSVSQFSRSVRSDSATPCIVPRQASRSITNFPEFTQTHVPWVSDTILPSHPLSSPSPPASNPSQKTIRLG